MFDMLAGNIAFVHRFLSSLIFTDVAETALLISLVWYVLRRKDLSLERLLFAGLWASFSTISYVWFVFPYLLVWPASVEIWFAEAFAFIFEAIFYRFVLGLRWRDALAVSFLCNVLSYFLGPLLRTHGLWIYW